MRTFCCLLLLACALPAEAATRKGTFRFTPVEDQSKIPQRYRLESRAFDYELDEPTTLPGVDVRMSRLRFPSPIRSATPENNTVHAEYYQPAREGPYPAVIVLDITGGNQLLSRFLATHLARHGIAGLFVQMAYYGPRRPHGSKLRLMSPNIPQTVAGVTQTVLDMRVAAAWLASRPEVDPERLGITGTSLGSFVSALTGEMEPRLGRVCVLLGGGNFIDGYAGHPLAAPYFRIFELLGGSRASLKKAIEAIDPITCAANLENRKLLILAASKDEIVPPSMARMLWEASGKQKLVWFPAGHYTAAFHLAEAFEHLLAHFGGS